MRQVTHALLTRPPLSHLKNPSEDINFKCFVRLACVKHAASVHPEPGSNSHVHILTEWQLAVIFPFFTVLVESFDSFVLKFSLNFRDCFIVQLSMSLLLFSHVQLLEFNTFSKACQQLFYLFSFRCFYRLFYYDSYDRLSHFTTSVNNFLVVFCFAHAKALL